MGLRRMTWCVAMVSSIACSEADVPQKSVPAASVVTPSSSGLAGALSATAPVILPTAQGSAGVRAEARPPSTANPPPPPPAAAMTPATIPPAMTPPAMTAAPIDASPAPGAGCLKGVGDYTKNGPYKTVMMDVTVDSSGPFTIFRPDPLDASCKHPIVAWGNGTGVEGSTTYAFYHNHAASWGIVVIASHNTDVGNGSFHKAGLDYLLAQNQDSNSPFFGKLSDKAGTTGHSQGGVGANAGAGHPNVLAEVNVQGASTTPPRNIAYLCLTGTEDINPEGCKSTVMQAREPAMLANWEGADHIMTAAVGGYFSMNPGTLMYMRLYTSWFRCFLGDDANACSLFKGGAMCPVCTDTGWHEVLVRNF